jgi:dihydrofolate reductase
MFLNRTQRVRVGAFAVSLDGYGAGPNQSLDDPLGRRGTEIFQWFFPTRTFRSLHVEGAADGSTGIDDQFARRSFENVGAFVMGRNMFSPTRGPWLDDSWKGWWGDNPPFHTPVFVLTHHPRGPLVMAGGTTFHFVTGGIEDALQQAKQAAGEKDVRIGGGVATIRQFLEAGWIDSLHLAFAPVLLGTGEPLFSRLDLHALGFHVTERVSGELATHIVLEKR